MDIGRDLRVVLGVLAGAGTGAVVLVVGMSGLAPLEPPDPGPALEGPSEPATVAAPDSAAAPETGRSAAFVATAGPRFDAVRMAPDGSGLVAGRAGPGAVVSVMAGDEIAAEVTADEEGGFVAFLNLSPSSEPRALSLRDGAGHLSDETVIVAPVGPAPDLPRVAVAAAPETPAADTGMEGRLPAAAGPVLRGLPSDRALPDLGPSGGRILALPEVDAAAPVPAGPGTPVPGAAAADPLPGDGAAPTEEPAPGMAVADLGPALLPDAGEEERADATSEPPVPSALPEPGLQVAAADIPRPEEPAGEAAPELEPALPAVTPGGAILAPPQDSVPEHPPAPALAEAPGALAAPETGTPGQDAILVSDAEGVRVIQPALAPSADPEILSTVALDAISYGDGGEIVLAGRAAGGGAVRLYLDNAPVSDVAVGSDGEWSTTLEEAAPGTYTLRVDQLDATGEVVSRIETPFRREAREDLAALMAEAQRPGQAIAMRVVQPGNTLWAIARDRYGEPLMYVQVFEMNRDRIRDPNLIYPGQVFILPARQGR